MNFFVVTISQCYLTVNLKRSVFLYINVKDESQAENRPVLVQGAEIR